MSLGLTPSPPLPQIGDDVPSRPSPLAYAAAVLLVGAESYDLYVLMIEPFTATTHNIGELLGSLGMMVFAASFTLFRQHHPVGWAAVGLIISALLLKIIDFSA
jgi:hypothetical protein